VLSVYISSLAYMRNKLEAYLATAACDTPASQANFVWLAAGDETDALQAHLMSRGIIGRAFSGTGIRISVGSPEANEANEANEALVDALGSYNRS
jgi:histidinol-phosphate aminotransferase